MRRFKGMSYMLLAFFLVTLPTFAASAAPAGDAASVAAKIIAIAGVVAAVLQGLKRFIPAITGPIAIVGSVVLAVAGAYAVADPGTVLSIQFFTTTLLAALGANGIHSFAKLAGGKSS